MQYSKLSFLVSCTMVPVPCLTCLASLQFHCRAIITMSVARTGWTVNLYVLVQDSVTHSSSRVS